MITDIKHIARACTQALLNMADEGELPPGEHDFECVFGFHPSMIAGLHTYKIGSGDGVYFRLRDGRVFSAYGDECPADPELYDTSPN